MSIKPHLKKFYYTDPVINCCRNYRPSLLFDDIKEYQYLEPIVRYTKYYQESLFHKELLKKMSKKIKLKTLMYSQEDINAIYLDEIMLQYVRCRPKTFTIILWPNVDDKRQKNVINFLKEHGNVYCVKKISMYYNCAMNVIYQVYSDTSRLSTIKKIKEKLEYTGWGKEGEKEGDVVTVVIFDNVKNEKISGSQASFKEQIRKLAGGDLLNHGKRGDDFVHINDKFYQTVENCQIFFHGRTLDFLTHQDLNTFLKLQETRTNFQTLKNWITEMIKPIDQDRLILIGGIPSAYGVREARDLDGILFDIKTPSRTNYLTEKFKRFLWDKNTNFPFVDFGFDDVKNFWRDSWTMSNNKIYQIIGVNNKYDLFTSPKNYFYFQGVKMCTIDFDITKRVLRARYSDFGDLYYMAKTLKIWIFNKLKPDFKEMCKKMNAELLSQIIQYIRRTYPMLMTDPNLEQNITSWFSEASLQEESWYDKKAVTEDGLVELV